MTQIYLGIAKRMEHGTYLVLLNSVLCTRGKSRVLGHVLWGYDPTCGGAFSGFYNHREDWMSQEFLVGFPFFASTSSKRAGFALIQVA